MHLVLRDRTTRLDHLQRARYGDDLPEVAQRVLGHRRVRRLPEALVEVVGHSGAAEVDVLHAGEAAPLAVVGDQLEHAVEMAAVEGVPELAHDARCVLGRQAGGTQGRLLRREAAEADELGVAELVQPARLHRDDPVLALDLDLAAADDGLALGERAVEAGGRPPPGGGGGLPFPAPPPLGPREDNPPPPPPPPPRGGPRLPPRPPAAPP